MILRARLHLAALLRVVGSHHAAQPAVRLHAHRADGRVPVVDLGGLGVGVRRAIRRDGGREGVVNRLGLEPSVSDQQHAAAGVVDSQEARRGAARAHGWAVLAQRAGLAVERERDHLALLLDALGARVDDVKLGVAPPARWNGAASAALAGAHGRTAASHWALRGSAVRAECIA